MNTKDASYGLNRKVKALRQGPYMKTMFINLDSY